MRHGESEEALMEAYVEGDPRAFRRLFESLAPALHAFFLRSARNAAQADDLMQATFLKLHAARAAWRRDRRLRPWVFTITARVRVDWLRGQGRPTDDLDEVLEAAADPSDGPGDALLLRERAGRVQAALDRLTEPQRVVIHLHRFEDLSFEEIGAVLGISEGAAKLRAFRAYDRLRALLSDLVGEGSR
jgi:RNA polymerase sigma-70 factor, ECF subfamily